MVAAQHPEVSWSFGTRTSTCRVTTQDGSCLKHSTCSFLSAHPKLPVEVAGGSLVSSRAFKERGKGRQSGWVMCSTTESVA